MMRLESQLRKTMRKPRKRTMLTVSRSSSPRRGNKTTLNLSTAKPGVLRKFSVKRGIGVRLAESGTTVGTRRWSRELPVSGLRQVGNATHSD